ncbi:MAG: tautomerase family protein [Thermoanaerobaculia bacterium]
MPLVHIHLRKGKSAQYLRDVGNSVHDALVGQANVPADDRFQIFHQHDADAIVADRTYAGVSRSDGLIIIEIRLNAGRTLEVKKALYADIAARLGRSVGISPDDVFISLTEVTKENWSFGKGIATYG